MVSGAMRGGCCSRSGDLSPTRSGGQLALAPSCGAGTVLLIVVGLKSPDRLGSLVLVAPELVVELELLQVRLTKSAARCRRASSAQRGSQSAICNRG